MSDKETLRIGEGKPGPGRTAGSPNKTTAVLKEAILLAAETVGSDGEGKDGLAGYCEALARSDRKTFATLLGKVLPMQVNHSGSIAAATKEQRDAAVAAASRADD